MSKTILNIADLEFHPFGHGDKYEARMGQIGMRLGAQKLGYNVTVLASGKRAFPFHCHRVNEEMFFVLEGKGEIRIGNERFPIRAGDVVACPAGGAETAHQIANTSDAELRYLSVSTKLSPDIAEYPDTGKYGVLAEFADAQGNRQMLRFITRGQATAEDYWEGE